MSEEYQPFAIAMASYTSRGFLGGGTISLMLMARRAPSKEVAEAMGLLEAQRLHPKGEHVVSVLPYFVEPASVDRSGEAGETRSGSTEGESAVTAKPADAQTTDKSA